MVMAIMNHDHFSYMSWAQDEPDHFSTMPEHEHTTDLLNRVVQALAGARDHELYRKSEAHRNFGEQTEGCCLTDELKALHTS